MVSAPSCGFNSTSQCNTLDVAGEVAAGFSILGSTFVLISILMSQQRNFIQKLLIYFNIATLLDTIPYFLVDNWVQAGSAFCTVQGFWIQFAEWAVMAWMVCLTYNLYVTIVHQKDTKLLTRIYQIACWGVSIIAAVIPLATGVYDHSGSWCWIKEDPLWVRFVAYYGPNFFVIFSIIAVYAYILWYMRRRKTQWRGTYRPEYEEERRLIRLRAHPLRFYPIVFVCLSLVGAANRVQNAIWPDDPHFFLYLLHAITAPLMGFLSALVFILSTDGILTSCSRARDSAFTSVHEYKTSNNPSVNLEDSDEESSRIESDYDY
eukprot:m.21605 g.21605  ORF g.21605 m.21605 type:complete len:319 (-) comp3645_c0_seq1:209-1165(-)